MRFLMYRGTIEDAPEQKFLQSGAALVNVRVREEGAPDSYRMTAFGPAADSLASLSAGDVVTLSGSCKYKEYTKRDGERGTLLNYTIDCVEVQSSAPRQQRAAPASDAGGIINPFDDQ